MSPVPRTRLTGGRLLALTIGLPLLLLLGSGSAVTIVGVYAHASERHQVSYSLAGGSVSLRITSGRVRIVAGGGNTVGVSYTEYYQLEKPKVTSTTTGGGVQLVATCPGGLLGSNCNVNYVISVPASTALTIHTGDGSVQSTGTIGVQSFDSGDGHVTLVNVGGSVSATTGDGSISATQLQARSVQASTGDGSISLGWAGVPSSVEATSGDGSIDITVPAASGPFRVSASTGDGSKHVNIPDDPSAASSIDARSGDGSVTIGYTR